MKWRKVVDAVFPHIEPLDQQQIDINKKRLDEDVEAIENARWESCEDRALDEVHRIAASEAERLKTAETKATTYLAVLAALVPLIITLQAANWEKKTGPAPEGLKLFVLALATVYIAAAGYHAFKTLQVSGFQRVGEAEVAAAWKLRFPMRRIIRSTLLATRRSRDAVNAKVTRIRVTHEHLLRAFGAFVLLLLLDPVFYAFGFRNADHGVGSGQSIVEAASGLDGDHQNRSESSVGARHGPNPEEEHLEVHPLKREAGDGAVIDPGAEQDHREKDSTIQTSPTEIP